MLPAQGGLQPMLIYDLELSWHILWCSRSEMLLQFLGWWEFSLPHAHNLSQYLPNAWISLYLLKIAKVGQQESQVPGERRGECACLCRYGQAGGMNTWAASLTEAEGKPLCALMMDICVTSWILLFKGPAMVWASNTVLCECTFLLIIYSYGEKNF